MVLDGELGYSERYEEALRVAAAAHHPQKRKGGDVPYITHPVHVSMILARYGFPMDVVLAGLLHDIVEDQDYPLSEVENRFGSKVAELVAAVSERKRDAGGAERPWEVRKRESLEHIAQAGRDVVALKAADALHNARALALDVREKGARLWQYFARGPGPKLRYYRQFLQVARERLGEHPLVNELADAVDDLAQAIGEEGG